MKRQNFEQAKSELEAAIKRLYGTFSIYPANPQMAICSHCAEPEKIQALFEKPLRELDADSLNIYSFKAITTWGNVEDFKHFLPRIFELMCHGTLPTFEEVILGKLVYAHWQTWEQQEQDAVIEFIRAWITLEQLKPSEQSSLPEDIEQILDEIGIDLTT